MIKMSDKLKNELLNCIPGAINGVLSFDEMRLSINMGVAKATFFYQGKEIFSLMDNDSSFRFSVNGTVPVKLTD